MKLSDFVYDLPPERIAQQAIEPRDAARMLVCERASGALADAGVRDLPEWLAPGDLLVVNDTRVLRARFFGRRASGGAVEVLLLEPLAGRPGAWRALLRPARRLRAGERSSSPAASSHCACSSARATPRASSIRPGTPRSSCRRASSARPSGFPMSASEQHRRARIEERIEELGAMPLPPYIRRAAEDPRAARDREAYQTIFASKPGAVAAPTAGLHFTPELLARLAERGVERASVTLHVGEGTFRPVTAERVEDHRMHAERYELPAETAAAIERCRARGGRVVAVGTTSVRVLETCAEAGGLARPQSGATDLFLVPGARFRVVDALLTNFHLPGSTLLMLVAAFAGRERVLALYAEAIARGYRFYSYGDALLLL